MLIAPLLLFGSSTWALGETKNRLSLSIADMYLSKSNYPVRGSDLYYEDENSNLAYLSPGLMVGLGDRITGRLSADFSWQYFFQNDVSESTQDWDMYPLEANLGFHMKRFDVQLGLQPIQFGEGLVFFDNVLAAEATYERNKIYTDFIGGRAFDSSPLAGAKAGYRSGPFEKLEAFGLWFQDRDDLFAEMLQHETFAGALGGETILENLTGEGYLGLCGVSLNWFLGDFYLTALGVYEFGTMEFDVDGGQRSTDVSAFMFDVGVEKNLFDKISIGFFCFSASGDSNPLRGRFTAFISPLPYNSRASIFFDSGFPDSAETDNLSFGGVTPFGVIAPGMSLTAQLHQDVLAECTLAGLYAQDLPENLDNQYGWELDLGVSWVIKTHYKLFLEASRFEYGDFFLNDQTDKPEAALRFLVGGRVDFAPFMF